MHRWFQKAELQSPTNPAYSQSWKKVGTKIDAADVLPGDVCVVPGHVALVVEVEPEIIIRGGNQSNKVCDQPLRYYAEPAEFYRV